MTGTHAYLILADDLESADIPSEAKQEGADTRHMIVPSFGIDEARNLKDLSGERSFGGDHYNFVIVTRSITEEAQNAILKLFEDPPVGAVFYLVIPSKTRLLPTLRSRLFLKHNRSNSKTEDLANQFLRFGYKERMEWIADVAKKDPDKLTDLVREISRSDLKSWSQKAKRSLLLAERYVYNRGAGKKMLIEELALALPIEK
jgi:DNA polymerase III delta prime subunit